jgi:hypothetical protein
VSNDQSPPARKVIPYKKGGPRKSPFADMAFQFSGTALDVAIQQREEGEVESPPEISETASREPSEEEHRTDSPPAPEVEPAQEIKAEAPEPPLRADVAAAQDSSPSAPAVTRPQPRQRRATSGGVRLVTDKRAGSAATEAADGQLQAFITRWKPFLTETQLGICTYVYSNSVPSGQEYCFTSTAKLMAAVSKTERQVKTVLNQLTEWGFLVKGETVVNAPREQRGTYYKLVVTKS